MAAFAFTEGETDAALQATIAGRRDACKRRPFTALDTPAIGAGLVLDPSGVSQVRPIGIVHRHVRVPTGRRDRS